MATMQFRYSTGIEPPIQTDSDHGPFQFRQPASYDGVEVLIEFSRGGDILTSSALAPISDGLASRFAAISDPNRMPAEDKEQLQTLFSPLPVAHRRILALILQELRIY